MVLEKAWAKVFGSYQRIEGGQTQDTLYALTGATCEKIYHEEVKNLKVLWELINDSNKKDYILCASVSSKQSKKQK